MTGKYEKVQMTVRLRPEVASAARKASLRNGTPVSVIIAEAAGQTLLPPPEESVETKVHNLSNRLLSRMETLERALGRELFLTRELVAQLARAYFNHTPAIPDQERAAASLSGRLRFVRLVEQVNVNAGQGVSILNDTEVPSAGNP
ncbi:MAG: hypothetical protein J5J06_20070 [Phycisphaerae bacterium]|nr:hypothetical protein [Phycisphaerae bacterium]